MNWHRVTLLRENMICEKEEEQSGGRLSAGERWAGAGAWYSTAWIIVWLGYIIQMGSGFSVICFTVLALLVYLFYPSRYAKGKKMNELSKRIRRNMTSVLVPHCVVVVPWQLQVNGNLQPIIATVNACFTYTLFYLLNLFFQHICWPRAHVLTETRNKPAL